MLSGSTLWDRALTGPMKKSIYFQKEQEVYQDAPSTLYTALFDTAQRLPQHTAIVSWEGRRYSYSQLLSMTDSFSSYLSQKLAVKKGTHVGILLYNGIQFCITFFALSRLGALAVPLPGKFKEQEIQSLIRKARLEALVCHRDYSAWVRSCIPNEHMCILSDDHEEELFQTESCDIPVCLDEEASAILMFTSGTTSKSKGVILSNYSVTHALCTYQRLFQLTSSDSTLLAVPIYHITGLIAILGTMVLAGGTTYIHKFFQKTDVVQTFRREEITFFHASPTVFSMLLQEKKEGEQLPHMRLLACGSSNMPKAKIQQLHEWMPNMKFRTVYGLTETSSPAAVFPDDAAVSPYIGSSGLPIPGVSIKIVDSRQMELPSLAVGEILLKGTTLLKEYYNTDLPAYHDGWFYTGDLGYLNEQGYLYISDRKKDMINRGGEKICSYDVENLLASMEQVLDAALVGIPDDLYGEVPAAALVLRPGKSLTLEEVQAYLKDKLAKYKIPVRILILSQLPETLGHKTDKKKIRELFLADAAH